MAEDRYAYQQACGIHITDLFSITHYQECWVLVLKDKIKCYPVYCELDLVTEAVLQISGFNGAVTG